MLLASLRVIHLPKLLRSDISSFSLEEDRARLEFVFHLDTCQREIWVLPESAMPPLHAKVEMLEGLDAYRFLLRVSTGLESQVQGETDIFGQLKSAWAQFEEGGNELARELGPWIQKLFEDTKEIRSRFLRNIGGESYGSLVRKYLRARDEPRTPPASVLLVGAGRLAHAVAPWLVDYRIQIANRTISASEALRSEILARSPGAQVEVLTSQAGEKLAWAKSRHVVVCVPLDEEFDRERQALWQASTTDPKQSLIHLGTLRAAAGAWSEAPGFFSLDDLFPLQQNVGELRMAQLNRAAKACDEKAVLRSLLGSPAGSVTLPHGWEDLASFS